MYISRYFNLCCFPDALAALKKTALCVTVVTFLSTGCIATAAIKDSAATQNAGQPTSKKTSPKIPKANEDDGGFHFISKFKIKYNRHFKQTPATKEVLKSIAVPLLLTDKGFVAPSDNDSKKDAYDTSNNNIQIVRLSQVPKLDKSKQQFSDTALLQINRAVVAYFNHLGFVGIRVKESPKDINLKTLKDLRDKDNGLMHILVSIAVVDEVRTIASGDRVEEAKRIDSPLHKKIREVSPLKSGDALEKDKVTDYVSFLNRHPGRHVNSSLSRGVKPDSADLDYMVAENKPWFVYAQVSNTGTKSTNSWRERFGFVNDQLTNNDDIFKISYGTSGFEKTHSASASYDAPLSYDGRVRWGIDGNWSMYNSSQFAIFKYDFTGRDWGAGAHVKWNFFQDKDFFMDLEVGARWKHVHVGKNIKFFGHPLYKDNSDGDFFLPRIGLDIYQRTPASSLNGSVNLEWNIPSIADTPKGLELASLGRAEVDRSWAVMHWNLFKSFYLEPLLNPDQWNNPNKNSDQTLANEISIGLLGQYAFGNRLIAQEQQINGGMYTVRGYPESLAAGDTSVTARAEYRFHLAKSLPLDVNPQQLFGQSFRYTPQHAFGQTDWDLVLYPFMDVGWTKNSNREKTIEKDHTLWSTGIGAELSVKRNFRVEADFGFALLPVKDVLGNTIVSRGSSRVSIAITLLY